MNVRKILFPPGASKHDWVFDAALTLVLGLLTVPVYLIGYLNSFTKLEIFISGLMIIPLILRRHSPIISLALITFASLLQVIYTDRMSASMVAIPVICYTVARWIPGRTARISVFIGLIGSVIGPIRWLLPDARHASLQQWIWLTMGVMICFGLVVTPYAIGRRIRESSEVYQQRVANAAERQRAEIVETEQQTRLTENRIRTQIARELHDIVAHSLSVIIVQAEGGKAMARKNPEAATAALDTIADTGREALTEMRRILGVLRAEPDGRPVAEFAPAPSLAEIPELVARTSDRITLYIHGNPPRVSQTLQLTTYRIVQEALTNFLKHAGPEATAQVLLNYGAHQIQLVITDNGTGPTQGDNLGQGLKGMRERVTSMGGFLTAGPGPSGGFQVKAVLPFVVNDETQTTQILPISAQDDQEPVTKE